MEKIRIVTSVFNLIFLLVVSTSSFGQTNISITIDDVPNTRKFEQDNYQSILLNKLDSVAIPIAIFINEGLIYKTDSIDKNFSLLNSWVKKDYTTIGNHTFGHSRYSEVGFYSFKQDIEKGEYITRELITKYGKTLQHFRFPYNDLGKDSIHHKRLDSLLQNQGYKTTPFTSESSDWMFNYVYEYYLEKEDFENASKTGNLYVSKTLEYIHFFDSLSVSKYGRKINQIYLCHDNSINADFLIKIIDELKEKNYNFISLDTALEDDAYQQENNYYRKWGVSWLYRWMPTQKERVEWMKQEPNIDATYDFYEGLINEKNK